ncbi:MAG: MarR family transcriptional regulator [Planctomycetota bacterium]
MTEDISVMAEIPFGRHDSLPFPHVTGYWVNRLAAAFRVRVDRDLREFDLTRRQVGMLHFIHRLGGASASDLTRSMGVDSTAVTRMVDRLEDKGLVERRPDPDDGRRSIVELTSAARRLMPRFATIARGVEETFEDGIDEADLATFHAVLMRMLENVGEAHFAMINEEDAQ